MTDESYLTPMDWLKDGRDLSLYPELSSRYSIDRDGSLHLSALRLGASGWYYCLPSNGISSHTKEGSTRGPLVFESDKLMSSRITEALAQKHTDVYAKAYLKLLYKPQTYAPSDAIYLAIDQSGRLPCPIAASPPIHSVQWKKEGSSLVLKLRDTRDFIREDHDESVDYEEDDIWKTYYYEWEIVKNRDAGLYRCQGFNRMGWGDWSSTIQIITAEMPYFSVYPNPVYQNVIGKSVTVPCQVRGHPLPTIQWLWSDGGLIRDIRYRIHVSGLTISELRPQDQNREVYCVAINPLARLVAASRIRVLKTTPEAPNNLTVTARLFSARLYWVPGFDGGDHQEFVVYYRIASVDDWLTMPVLSNSSNPSAYILGLLPEEEYVFSILSRNRYGDGLFSPTVQTRTLGYQESLSRGYLSDLPRNALGEYYYPPMVKQLGPPPASPHSLTINLTNEGSILLSWKPPSNISSLPSVLYYRAEYSSSVTPTYERSGTQLRWHQLTPVRVPQCKYILPELPNRQLIAGLRFRVRAYALLSVSHPSNEVNVPSNILATLMKVQRPGDWLMTVVWLCIAFLIILSLILGTLFVVRKSWHAHRHQARPTLPAHDDKFDDSNSVFSRSLHNKEYSRRRLSALFHRATSNSQVFPRSSVLIQRLRNRFYQCVRKLFCSCLHGDASSPCCSCSVRPHCANEPRVAVTSDGAMMINSTSSFYPAASTGTKGLSFGYLDGQFDLDTDSSQSMRESVDIHAENVSFQRFESVDYPNNCSHSVDCDLTNVGHVRSSRQSYYPSKRNLSFERAIQSSRKRTTNSPSNGAVASSPQNSNEVTVLHLSSEFSSVTPNSGQATTSTSTLAKQLSDFTFTTTDVTTSSSGLYIDLQPGSPIADACQYQTSILHDNSSSATLRECTDSFSRDPSTSSKDENVVRKRHSTSPENPPSAHFPATNGEHFSVVPVGFSRQKSNLIGASPESGYLSRAGSHRNRFSSAVSNNHLADNNRAADSEEHDGEVDYALWLHCERLKAEFQIH